MTVNVKAAIAFFLILAAGGACLAGDLDWPWWRGPDGNGISKETGWNPQALEGMPKILWTAKVEAGFSSVAIRGDHLYTMGNDGTNDIVFCLKAGSGEEVWRFTYPCRQGEHKGPRATPAVDENSVYTMSREGLVHRIDAKTGKAKWKLDLDAACQAKPPTWGFASSPVIEGGMLLLNAGRNGMALNRKTGQKVWGAGGIGGYAAVVLFPVGRRRCAAVFAKTELAVVDVRSGQKLWACDWKTEHSVNASDPVPGADMLFIASGYGRGCAGISTKKGRFQKVWESTEICSHFQSAVCLDGHIYGTDGNTGRSRAHLKCLDIVTGDVKWTGETGWSSVIASDGKLILLDERGVLTVAEASPAAFKVIAKSGIIEKSHAFAKWWTPPVLCRGRIFCRDSLGKLVCIDVRG